MTTARPLFLLGIALAAIGCGGGPQPVEPQPTPRRVLSGEQLYVHCRACHGADGAGVARINPPLLNSPYLAGDDANLVRIIRDGYRSDRGYTGIMSGFNNRFRDEEIVTLVNWLRQRWAPGTPDLSIATVRRINARGRPWSRDELQQLAPQKQDGKPQTQTAPESD